MFTNGWNDIGYNWLIDPNGVIYQGRGDNVRGAHFCGNNTGTMGVCVMGDFTVVLPLPDAVSSLQDLLAWKICDADVTADGSTFHSSSGQTLNHISGHRQGCATACPGDTFFPTLPAVRDSVKWMIDNGCDTSLLSDTYIIDENTVEVFPNPTDGLVNVTVDSGFFGEMSVSVFNVVGEVVLAEMVFEKKNEQGNVEVDLSGLGAGVYFLKIRQKEQEGLMRVVCF